MKNTEKNLYFLKMCESNFSKHFQLHPANSPFFFFFCEYFHELKYLPRVRFKCTGLFVVPQNKEISLGSQNNSEEIWAPLCTVQSHQQNDNTPEPSKPAQAKHCFSFLTLLIFGFIYLFYFGRRKVSMCGGTQSCTYLSVILLSLSTFLL